MTLKVLPGEQHKLKLIKGAIEMEMKNSTFYNKITKIRSSPGDFWRSIIPNNFL